MKSIYIVTFLMLFFITEGSDAITIVSDNRVPLKNITWDTLGQKNEIIKSRLTHYHWRKLIYSNKISYKIKKYYQL